MVLPSELLVTRSWKGTIRPKYASLNSENIAAAANIISLYRDGAGLSKAALRDRLSTLEDSVPDYRFIRGVAVLVERRCTFESPSAIDPILVRRELFEASARRGFPSTESERQAIIAEVAVKLHASPLQIESSMYADLEAEQILRAAPPINPIQLLKEYNLSLSQTLLFHCTEMSFAASKNWQNIFRAVKRLGLIYTVEGAGSALTVKLDGPLSLFKLNRRYGTAMANVLPEIIKGGSWRLNAQILHKWSNKLLSFQLESSRHGWLFPEVFEVEAYDSTVESEFAKDFAALGTRWTLKREPEPVATGNSVMIPDFAFQLGGAKVYLEIIGFWTRQYLEKKIEKLRGVGDLRFIIAVDEDLACEKLSRLQGFNIVYYRGRIPARRIAELLRSAEAEEAARQAASFKIELTEPIVTVTQLSERSGVMKEVILQCVDKLKTHVLIGETLIEKDLAEAIRRSLDHEIGDNEVTLPYALNVLQRFNLPEPVQMLTHCGYKVNWRGILMEDAKVTRCPS